MHKCPQSTYLCITVMPHVNAVKPAMCAPSTAHNCLCHIASQLQRKPFPAVPVWSEAARPGVLCSQSLCCRTWLSWVTLDVICEFNLQLGDAADPTSQSHCLTHAKIFPAAFDLRHPIHLSLVSFIDFNVAVHLCCVSVIWLHVLAVRYTHTHTSIKSWDAV